MSPDPNRPCAIAVAGMSGSGKTTFAEAVAERLGAALLRTDDYYRPFDHLTYDERCEVNYDHPDSVDGARLAAQLGSLLSGQSIDVPHYDFTRHTWSNRVRTIKPTSFIVVEGIFALAYEEVAQLCAVRTFVDASEQTCLQRRVARDVLERGRTESEVVARFRGHVAPMFRIYTLPTRQKANVTVSGEGDLAAGVDKILALLPDRMAVS